MVVEHEAPEVQEVIALVHERDELLARLAVLDQLLSKAVAGERPVRAPALPQMKAARPPARAALPPREKDEAGPRCGKCKQQGHNARTCGRSPKKPRPAAPDPEPEPAPCAVPSRPSDLVETFYPFVEKVAARLVRRLPAHVQLGELVSAGVIGLMDAAERFDPTRAQRFEDFAEFRIRGAMLDELRGSDSLSRDMRRLSNEIRDATRRLESQLGRTPMPDEIAAHLGISVDELYSRQKKLSGSSVVGIDDAGPDFLERTSDRAAVDPFESASRREIAARLIAAIEALPERQRQVMSLYYFDELGLRAIGKILGVTESRACQIHAEAARRLRDALGEDFGSEAAA